METFQKLTFDNSSQKNFVILSNFPIFLYFVSDILSEIVLEALLYAVSSLITLNKKTDTF